MKKVLLLLCLFLNACHASIPLTDKPITPGDFQLPPPPAQHVWPAILPLPPPDGLRPCCAFGYNIRAKLLGVPVPFFNYVMSSILITRESITITTAGKASLRH
ncbi:hypothetical protein ERHA54_37530 [Erwinia rhapontici]|nr:hypothetical protein ERHA54_37530 [Erwinia rhapontici]